MKCPWCSNPEGMPPGGGTEYSVDEIVRESVRSRPLFFSGGGVTFTGGEATVQGKELIEVLKGLKNFGIHTAIETNGSSPQLPKIQEFVDYLIMDFKHYDDERFLEFTGVRIDEVKRNFEYLTSIGRQLHIRIPLINHFNADSPQGFAEYFSKFDTKNVVFEFLPYHEYGRGKWKSEYKISDGFVTDEQINEFRKIFDEYSLRVIET